MAVLYISPTGAGAGDGRSIENAATLANLPSLIAAAGPDGEIRILADQGSYQAGSAIILASGGTDGHPVTIRGVDSAGDPMRAEIVGTRSDPFDPSGAVGEQVFRLTTGADNLAFADLSFKNIGYGAFRVDADIRNLAIEHVDATNVQRFFENFVSGDSLSATISGLVIRDADIDGFSRGAVRLGYDTHDVLIEDVHGDSQRQDETGDAFAIGVHLEGTVHDVVIRNSSMDNAEDRLGNKYWNGDGFATEGGVYNVLIADTSASGNVDAGFDIKSSSTVLFHTVADDNGRNFRIWSKDAVLDHVVSLDPNLRGGNSSQNDFWFAKSAAAQVISPVISDGDSNVAFSLTEGRANVAVTGMVAILGPTVTLSKGLSGSVFNSSGAITPVAVASGANFADRTTGVAIYASSDADHALTGGHAADVLRGAAGNDTLVSGEGDDVLLGGAGNDVLTGGLGADIIVGGSGFDVADYSASSGSVDVDLSGSAPAGAAKGDVLVGIEGVVGSSFADVLIGSANANLLIGKAGDDTLAGGDGDDVLNGGAGADLLVGGGGSDTADYSDSAGAVVVDLVSGTGRGADAEGDRLDGIEIIVGSSFDDTLVGGASGVRFIGGGGADRLVGGTGIDVADYSRNAVGIDLDLSTGTSSGGDATGDTLTDVDVIQGSDFADSIVGDAKSNTLIGGKGDDVLDGMEGNDVLVGGAGADTLTGGAGSDTADYSGNSTAMIADLAAGTASGGEADGDRLAGIEIVIGSSFGDTLLGDGLANRLEGGAGDDRLSGRGGGDVLSGGAGFDTADYSLSDGSVSLDLVSGAGTGDAAGDVLESIEAVVGSAFDDVVVASGTVRRLDGGAGDDRLTGSEGDDTLVGGAGADRLAGRGGVDTADYSASQAGVAVALDGTAGTAGDGLGDVLLDIERVVGSRFDDTLTGGGADEEFVGGEGRDILTGGAGFDTATYASSSAAVKVDLRAGTGFGGEAEGDRLQQIEKLIGSDYADTLTGDDGDNVIAGGLGADILDGGLGNDTADYSSSKVAMVVDLVKGTASDGDSLTGIENVIGSSFSDKLVGNEKANALVGGAGDDTLDGGQGVDTLAGGAGDDRYIVDNVADVVVEAEGAGSDRVDTTSAEYTLGANVEQLAFLGSGNFLGKGNELLNVFLGSSGNEVFYGFGGDDKFQGSLGADTFYGGEGRNTADYSKSKAAIVVDLTTNVNQGGDADGDRLYDVTLVSGSNYGDSLTGAETSDTLYGRGGNDTLYGLGGNDKLDGGAGVDTLVGGAGDDLYIVDDAADQTIEMAGGGYDRVSLSLNTWRLADNIEALATSTASSFTGYGNALNNSIAGNTNADFLYGLDGDDTLIGLGGADHLFGGKGSDTASYAASGLSVVVNLATSVNHGGDAEGDVFDGIENVVGSAYADRLTGDDGANILTGLAGNDSIFGGGGNDVIVGGMGDDTIDGGAGQDEFWLSGSRFDYNFRLVGGDLVVKDLRSGSDGTDIVRGIESIRFENGTAKPAGAIEGTAGNDLSYGTRAADTFFFDTGQGRSLGSDTIRDFGAGDRIVTTSMLAGTNSSGRVRANSSDRFALPGTEDGDAGQTTGSVKFVSTTGKTVSTLQLAGTAVDQGVTYYIYGATGDTTVSGKLNAGAAFSSLTSLASLKSLTDLTGSQSADDLVGSDEANVIHGLAGKDRIDGRAGDDLISGGADDDTIDGGSGYDTLLLNGHRGDYAFSNVDGAIIVRDLRAGSASDGVDTVFNIEAMRFELGDGAPKGSAIGGAGNDVFTAKTNLAETFFFDTGIGLAVGTDTIRNFGFGDKIVTTSAIYDGNHDGIIRADRSDRFALPGSGEYADGDSVGSLQIFNENGKAVSSVQLTGVVNNGEATYYVYSQMGDVSDDGIYV